MDPIRTWLLSIDPRQEAVVAISLDPTDNDTPQVDEFITDAVCPMNPELSEETESPSMRDPTILRFRDPEICPATVSVDPNRVLPRTVRLEPTSQQRPTVMEPKILESDTIVTDPEIAADLPTEIPPDIDKERPMPESHPVVIPPSAARFNTRAPAATEKRSPMDELRPTLNEAARTAFSDRLDRPLTSSVSEIEIEPPKNESPPAECIPDESEKPATVNNEPKNVTFRTDSEPPISMNPKQDARNPPENESFAKESELPILV